MARLDLLRRLRGVLTGLNAISVRFDLLQSRLDASSNVDERIEESLAMLHTKLEMCASKSELNTVIDSQEKLKQITTSLHCLDQPMSGSAQVDIERVVQYRRGYNSSDLIDVLPPNPISARLEHRLAFLLHNIELINHFAPVWDLLPADSFDVLLHGVETDEGHAALGRWQCGILSTEGVLREGARYLYLVSNHPLELGEFPLIKRLADWNIRFMYSAGKSGWNLSDWNRLYDLILCFGPHHAHAFTSITDAQVIQMGYPRFDRYFNDYVELSALQCRYKCTTDRKTVVWLPTWKSLSSVGLFDAEISALTDRYNVVVKLHPLMSQCEPDRVEALRKYPFTCVVSDSTDNLPLYQLADYMLFDYGGPPLAAIYVDKKLILLNVPGAENDPLAGPDSPDVHIRSSLGGVTLGDQCIAHLLDDDAHWTTQASVRKALRKIYFAPYFGFSANVAANALMHLEVLIDGGI